MIDFIVLSILFGLLFCYNYTLVSFLTFGYGGRSLSLWFVGAVAAVKMGIVMIASIPGVPLVLLYFLMSVAYGVMLKIILRSQKESGIFRMALSTAFFMICHLICFSLTALIIGEEIYILANNFKVQVIVMIIALVFMESVLLYFKNKITPQNFKILFDNKQQLGYLQSYLWFSLACLYFDSFLAMTNLSFHLVPVFLSGSCILMGFQLWFFVGRGYDLACNVHYENELLELEKKLDEQIKEAMHLKKLATTDLFTGVYSRRYIFERFKQLLENEESHFSFVYIDIDGLKRVNDTYGHKAGDDYLKAIVTAIKGQLREQDVFGRIGGDEFILLLPSTAEKKADKMMLHAWTTLEQKKRTKDKMSFSWGSIEIKPGETPPKEELIKKADAKMYRYKRKKKALKERNER